MKDSKGREIGSLVVTYEVDHDALRATDYGQDFKRQFSGKRFWCSVQAARSVDGVHQSFGACQRSTGWASEQDRQREIDKKVSASRQRYASGKQGI
jgi:hypothetical protein